MFTIRKRKNAKHPYVIVGKSKTEFKAMSITHSSKDNHRNNLKLKVNPNPNDTENAFLRKQVITDFKFNFSKAFKNYKLSNEDIDEITKYLESKKKEVAIYVC